MGFLVRRLKWAGHVAGIEQSRNAHRALVGKPEPLERPRRRCEDNINMDLREIVCNARICIRLLKIGTNSGLI